MVWMLVGFLPLQPADQWWRCVDARGSRCQAPPRLVMPRQLPWLPRAAGWTRLDETPALTPKSTRRLPLPTIRLPRPPLRMGLLPVSYRPQQAQLRECCVSD